MKAPAPPGGPARAGRVGRVGRVARAPCSIFFLTKDHTRTSRVTCDTMHAKPRTRDAHNNTHTQPSHSHTP
jgi:hypothetical protein